MYYREFTTRTLSAIASVFCIILTILVIVATIKIVPYDSAKNLKADIAIKSKTLTKLDNKLAKDKEDLSKAEAKLTDLAEKERAADKIYKDARTALEEVCTNPFYSPYTCDDASICEDLHTKTISANSSRASIRKSYSECEDLIKDKKESIIKTTKDKEDLEKVVKNLAKTKKTTIVRYIFSLLPLLVAIVGLLYLVRHLLQNLTFDDPFDGRLGVIAFDLLMASSYFCAIFCHSFFPNTLVFCIATFIFIAFHNILSYYSDHIIAYRYFLVIASIAFFFVAVDYVPYIAFFFTITMILVAFIEVPCECTEYLHIGKHIFYSIISFGIWHLVWLHNTTNNLNTVKNTRMRIPLNELLLCAFLPFYYFYWIYKTAEITERYGEEVGYHFKIITPCVALSVVCPLLASIIIQDKINIIVGKLTDEFADED